MTSIKLVLNRCKVLQSGNYPLAFQILHERRKRLIYTPYYLRSEDFDPIAQRATGGGSGGDARKINTFLRREKRRLDQILNWLEQNRPMFSVDDIVERYRGDSFNPELLDYLRQESERKRERGHDGIATAYDNTASMLQKFLKGRVVRIREIVPSFVMRFADYMSECGLSQNTVNYHLRNLKTIYNRATRYDDEQTLKPFKNFSLSPILDENSPQSLYAQYRGALRRTNLQLKTIGRLAHLDTPLTTYSRRHPQNSQLTIAQCITRALEETGNG